VPGAPLVVRLRPPHVAVRLRAALLLVAAGALGFGASFSETAAPFLVGGAGALLGVALFWFWAARRVARWSAFGLRLDADSLTVPLRPFYRRATQSIPLDHVLRVELVAADGVPMLVVVSQVGTHRLPTAWFPEEAPAAAFAMRVLVRATLAKRRAGRELGELAAVEACLEADSAHGAIVRVVDGTPEIVTLLTSEEDRDRAEREGMLRTKGARVYVVGDEARAVRDTVEHLLGGASPRIRP
jgi:hypothetical protein